MKKFSWGAVIAASIFGILILCCSNGLNSNATVKGEGITVRDTLEISITAEENLEIFSTGNKKSNGRTIISEAFDINGSGDDALVFYLWGETQTGMKLNPKKVTVTPSDAVKGTVTLDIDCYNWNLTLAATNGAVTSIANLGEGQAKYDDTTNYDSEVEAVMAEAVLIGYANVDMMFTNVINFTVSPKGLTKVGDISLKLVREGDWQIPDGYTAEAFLYDLTTGEKILGSDGTSNLNTVLYDANASIDSFNLSTTAAADTTPSYNANGKTVKPGIYLFQIEFRKVDEVRYYVWNDTLVVFPGKTTTSIHETDVNTFQQLITIPDLIGSLPDALESAKVEYVDDTWDKMPGYYTAHFTWKADNTKTETNFAMELLEIADSVAADDIPTTVAEWETFVTTATNFNNLYKFDHYNDVRDSHLYTDGTSGSSLFTNKTSLYLNLELGKRYVARMASENNAGKSNWKWVDLQTNYKTINQYRITYHLQQGTWKDGATEKTTDQIEYDGQYTRTASATGHAIIVPNGDGTAGNPKLYNGPATWLYWSQGVGGTAYPCTDNVYDKPIDYAEFANLDLYAVYMREGNIIRYDDNDYDIIQSYVTISNKSGTALSLVKGTKNEYSKDTAATADGKATVSLKLPAADDNPDTNDEWKYDKVIFEITYGGRTYVAQEQVGAERDGTSSNDFVIDLKNMPTGYAYNCKLTAHYRRTIVSYPFVLFLTD